MKKIRLYLALAVIATMLANTSCSGTESILASAATNLETEEDMDESETEAMAAVAGDIVTNETVVEDQEEEARTAMDIVNDMRIGWNLGNTLDSFSSNISITDAPIKSETAWGNPETTKELIDTVIDSGFNVIRIPVTWTQHIGEAPDYEVSQSWLERVKEIVDYAYDRGVYVIINTHHEDWNYPYYDNYDAAAAKMSALWTQIAMYFADYDEHLIFEGQNEPRKVGTSLEWNGGDEEGWEVVNRLNKVFVESVRATGGNNSDRLLMVCGYGANSTVGIRHIDLPENDDRIIVSVHSYEPYDFALNTAGRSTWNDDTTAIDTLMDDLKTMYIDKGIPVIIGEFGAMNKNNEDERAHWAAYYVGSATKIGVKCIWWDNGAFNTNGENFGLIDRKTYEWKYPKVLSALMENCD